MILLDTCCWIEWITDGKLADVFRKYLQHPEQLLAPTTVQMELYKWVKRERDESLGLEVVAFTQQGQVVPLDTY